MSNMSLHVLRERPGGVGAYDKQTCACRECSRQPVDKTAIERRQGRNQRRKFITPDSEEDAFSVVVEGLQVRRWLAPAV